MLRKTAISLLCSTLLFSVPLFELAGSAADVETIGDLTVQGVIESTSGGVKFPDSTVQTTAYAGSAGGVSITSPDGSITVGGTLQAPTVAVNSVSAAKIIGSLPVSQVSGAAITESNTFTGTQTISSGNLALPATAGPASGVLTIGGASFLHAYGSANVFAGSGAGNFSMTGAGGNSGFGQGALTSDTTGNNNSALGFHSLLLNTTGSANTASGSASLTQNTTGSGNTASGTSTLTHNTAGNNNTAFGNSALYNSTGDANTALGYHAGYNQTTGGNNTYIGFNVLGVAGETNTIRIGNGTTQAYIAGMVNAGGFAGDGSGLTNLTAAAVSGNIAGSAANVTGIVAIANGGTGAASTSAARSSLGVPGLATANSFTTGPQTFASGAAGNIALLVQGAASQTANLQEWRNSGGTAVASVSSAGDFTTSGNLSLPATGATSGVIKFGGNTFIHSYGANNFFAGQSAGNQTMGGDTNTAIGSNSLHANTGGSYNTALGSSSMISNNGGLRNTAAGAFALQDNVSGNGNTGIGYEALMQSTATGNTALGYQAGQTIKTGGSNTFIGFNADADTNLSAITDAMAIGANAIVDDSYHIRIGDAEINQIGGQVAWSNLSDIRKKNSIKDLGYGLAFIKELRPVEFRLNNGNGRTDFGFIAQDIEALLGTDYNVLGIGGDADRTLSLRYTDFIAPMVKAMQEQQEMIESQNETIKLQREEIRSLEGRIARIESMLSAK